MGTWKKSEVSKLPEPKPAFGGFFIRRPKRHTFLHSKAAQNIPQGAFAMGRVQVVDAGCPPPLRVVGPVLRTLFLVPAHPAFWTALAGLAGTEAGIVEGNHGDFI